MRVGVTSVLVLAAAVAGGCISGDDDGSPPPLPAVPGVSGSPDGLHLYVANLDGSGIRRLSTGRTVNLGPVWAPSGRAIAVRTSREAGGGAENRVATSIEVFAPDGRKIRRIETPDATGRVAWSPDSLRFAYVVNPPPRQGSRPGSLVARPVGGGGPSTISERARPHVQDGPAWSPDGRRIAFASVAPAPTQPNAPAGAPRPSVNELSVVGADGRDERRLTDNGQPEESEPAWLDDDRVLFLQLVPSNQPGPSRRMLVADAGGGSPRVVLPGLDYTYPALSPDRRSVALVGTTDPRSGGLHLRVARIGAEPKQVAPDPALDRPTWSPDGRQIAFASGSRVIAVRPDGSDRRVVVELAGRMIREVAWSPDGKRIAFTTGGPITPRDRSAPARRDPAP
jgi:tricorn protease